MLKPSTLILILSLLITGHSLYKKHCLQKLCRDAELLKVAAKYNADVKKVEKMLSIVDDIVSSARHDLENKSMLLNQQKAEQENLKAQKVAQEKENLPIAGLSPDDEYKYWINFVKFLKIRKGK